MTDQYISESFNSSAERMANEVISLREDLRQGVVEAIQNISENLEQTVEEIHALISEIRRDLFKKTAHAIVVSTVLFGVISPLNNVRAQDDTDTPDKVMTILSESLYNPEIKTSKAALVIFMGDDTAQNSANRFIVPTRELVEAYTTVTGESISTLKQEGRLIIIGPENHLVDVDGDSINDLTVVLPKNIDPSGAISQGLEGIANNPDIGQVVVAYFGHGDIDYQRDAVGTWVGGEMIQTPDLTESDFVGSLVGKGKKLVIINDACRSGAMLSGTDITSLDENMVVYTSASPNDPSAIGSFSHAVRVINLMETGSSLGSAVDIAPITDWATQIPLVKESGGRLGIRGSSDFGNETGYGVSFGGSAYLSSPQVEGEFINQTAELLNPTTETITFTISTSVEASSLGIIQINAPESIVLPPHSETAFAVQVQLSSEVSPNEYARVLMEIYASNGIELKVKKEKLPTDSEGLPCLEFDARKYPSTYKVEGEKVHVTVPVIVRCDPGKPFRYEMDSNRFFGWVYNFLDFNGLGVEEVGVVMDKSEFDRSGTVGLRLYAGDTELDNEVIFPQKFKQVVYIPMVFVPLKP